MKVFGLEKRKDGSGGKIKMKTQRPPATGQKKE